MTGHRPFDDLRKQKAPERRARNAAKTKALLEEMALHEVRLAREKPSRTSPAPCMSTSQRWPSWNSVPTSMSAISGAI